MSRYFQGSEQNSGSPGIILLQRIWKEEETHGSKTLKGLLAILRRIIMEHCEPSASTAGESEVCICVCVCVCVCVTAKVGSA